MRKLFGLVLMITVCIAYFFMIRVDDDLGDTQDTINKVEDDKKEDISNELDKQSNEVVDAEINENINEVINKRLLEIEEIIQNEYPQSPRDVIVIHNELMQMGYSKSFNWNADIYQLVELLRSVYAQELNDLNDYELQVATMKNTLKKGVQTGEYIVYSTIEDVEMIDEYKAKVTVMHQMTKSMVVRDYLLKKNDNWKIYSWDNIEVIQLEEESEE